MIWTSALLSFGIGSVLGIIYGLSFLLMKARPLEQATYQSIWKATVLSALRILGIGILFLYLLRITFIQPILVVVSFFVFFWLIIVKYTYG